MYPTNVERRIFLAETFRASSRFGSLGGLDSKLNTGEEADGRWRKHIYISIFILYTYTYISYIYIYTRSVMNSLVVLIDFLLSSFCSLLILLTPFHVFWLPFKLFSWFRFVTRALIFWKINRVMTGHVRPRWIPEALFAETSALLCLYLQVMSPTLFWRPPRLTVIVS